MQTGHFTCPHLVPLFAFVLWIPSLELGQRVDRTQCDKLDFLVFQVATLRYDDQSGFNDILFYRLALLFRLYEDGQKAVRKQIALGK